MKGNAKIVRTMLGCTEEKVELGVWLLGAANFGNGGRERVE